MLASLAFPVQARLEIDGFRGFENADLPIPLRIDGRSLPICGLAMSVSALFAVGS
jgi:hypothetical protein